MTMYSEEFKLMIVKEYMQGELGYRLLAKKYLIPSVTPIKRWVRAYQHYGVKGVQKPRSKPVYSVQFKLHVLHFRNQTGASLQETATAFDLHDPSLIS
ncbi:helix-turn-helix domain-containing protein, partial [Alkalicoccus daliensis]